MSFPLPSSVSATPSLHSEEEKCYQQRCETKQLLSIFFLYHFAQLLESYPSPSYNSLADTACLPLFSFIYFTPAQSWARVLPSSKPRNPDINQFSVNACHLYKIELKPIRAKISRFKEQQANGGKMFRKKNRIAPGALNKARECNRTSAPQRA